MEVVFIRHGQSCANIGLPCDAMATIPLTETGEQQSAARAESWTRKPMLILVSPYLRTQQTAAPTIARFPDVPVEEWEIHEFNNLHPERWKNEREHRVAEEHRQWAVCDPEYKDGGSAESFVEFHGRAEAALACLAKLPAHSLVYAFSHGYFMQAVRLALTHPELAIGDRMRIFRPADGSLPYENTATFSLEWNGSNWSII